MNATAQGTGEAALRALLDAERPLAVGVEEEVMLLDRGTLDLAPIAAEVLPLAGDGFKQELPASQIEIVTPPRAGIPELAGDLLAARRRLQAAVEGRARLAAAGAHPFAAAEGELSGGGRYRRLQRQYGAIARRQLVCGLHVHVGLCGAERMLAVYNELRAYLPELAALGANAPLRDGADTGLASVRPLISAMLPRQGVPPAYGSLAELAGDLAWAGRAGRVEGALGWWWELRLHPALGTLEVRVPDAQSLVANAAAVAAVAASLVLWLAEIHDAEGLPEPVPGWRIAENRFSALHDGVSGQMLDLRSGRSRPTRERLHEMLDAIGPAGEQIGAAVHLRRARGLAEHNGADAQRELARELGPWGMLAELSRCFCEPPPSGVG